MNRKNKLCITHFDYNRIKLMISDYTKRNKMDPNIKDLLGEIERAQKVDSHVIPPNFVTMNSVIELKNLNELEFQEFRLVFPEEANTDENKISVLAPIGTAILGYKIGDVIQWKIPSGVNQFQITNIKYQPEANGDYHL
ncbi:nucleoside diphosphate kinase regulator [Leptospira sp. 2 VSF19]|uniref:Nucleoside diphosphate kinase regulator n=1 Tax=Leptospira soteropolitanensis TaxID=2950025 RepID=A0AAW5VIH1_9LEPT|nr:nucleoside diphosphate kinase regulator [Leptospira soteropolitanensis]MCW7493548.1 nucleoside diphosphate kinase regulator [Leptospira soteropolitanensis]MCW7500921.1 nucleoside diphosphate kinase regulator [Leptospira soteropolitanensis]MCW7523399.1 nucleoside diphosphate kinase regulator [Leptospira soteropolitanensis]MCW7527260.1 nucleoside diphosphate kinase regulator [Leptospira soteropolitanensis]MCW7531117.1 nucleoside diphosphate kinase regulator [Leptospira soteropolitanensis]